MGLGKCELELSEGWDIHGASRGTSLKGTTGKILESQTRMVGHVDNEGTSEWERCTQEG